MNFASFNYSRKVEEEEEEENGGQSVNGEIDITQKEILPIFEY